MYDETDDVVTVSTHSRLKAAGYLKINQSQHIASFNTQPPEGGWNPSWDSVPDPFCFNTQPPEGGWNPSWDSVPDPFCFNTQPPEGGWTLLASENLNFSSCFNTQPPEGGWRRR